MPCREAFYDSMECVEILIAAYDNFRVIVLNQVRREARYPMSAAEHPVLHKISVGVACGVFIQKGSSVVARLRG